MSNSVDLVLAYIEAAQRARSSGLAEDFDMLHEFLADEVEMRQASPWTDEPWRTAHLGADALVERLRAPVNAGSRLTTQTVNAVVAGPDILVEQVSTLHTDDGDKVSCVAHLFTLSGNRITGIRTYRNDADLPAD